MDIPAAIILGIVQGFTEFLPISSSGHLVIVQSLLPNFSQPGVLFDTILHAGTLGAVLIFFRSSIIGLKKNELMLYAVGTIPAVLVGFLLGEQIELLFTSTKMVGLFLLVTGVMNFITHRKKTIKDRVMLKDSVFIGIFQALAILPGISRSGSTIFAATSRGVKKRKAAEFSFVLSVPAVLGANIYQVMFHTNISQVDHVTYFIGFVAALLSGYFAIRMVMSLLKKNKFNLFGFYCMAVGVLVVFL